MKVPRRLLIVLLLAALLNACGGAPEPSNSQVDAVLTEGVKTMVASYFETQTAMAPLPTATSLPPTFPPTPAFTPVGYPGGTPQTPATPTFFYFTPTFSLYFSPTVTGTLPTGTVNPGGQSYGCNNLAFIADVNYPPGTSVAPGENFTKIWKVANTGTCEWRNYYRLLFVSGHDFDPPSVNLGRIVDVNHWAEVSLNLDAPKNNGTFSAYWRMSDGDGHMFGATLGVTVKVGGGDDRPTPGTGATPTKRGG